MIYGIFNHPKKITLQSTKGKEMTQTYNLDRKKGSSLSIFLVPLICESLSLQKRTWWHKQDSDSSKAHIAEQLNHR